MKPQVNKMAAFALIAAGLMGMGQEVEAKTNKAINWQQVNTARGVSIGLCLGLTTSKWAITKAKESMRNAGLDDIDIISIGTYTRGFKAGLMLTETKPDCGIIADWVSRQVYYDKHGVQVPQL